MKRRIALLVAPKKFQIVEEEIQPLDSNDILVKVIAVGLCHSDVPTYLGESAMGFSKYGLCMEKDIKFPTVVGHEPVGVVEAVGAGVTKFKVGDYVGGFAMGAFASHLVVNENTMAKIPPTDKEIKHCLPEPLMCITNIVRAAKPEFGDYVAVVGCGMMGLLTIAGLKNSGAQEIIAIDLDDSRLKKAKEMGATITINPKNEDLQEKIHVLTQGAGADVVVEITGSLKGLNTATMIVRNADLYGYKGRGKILIPSVYGRAETWDPNIGYNLMFKSPILHSTHPLYSLDYMDDCAKGINGYIKGTLPLDKLITHEFKLEDIEKAFETMVSGADGYIKGIVLP